MILIFRGQESALLHETQSLEHNSKELHCGSLLLCVVLFETKL